MHMLAAHGANAAGYARETERIKQELTEKPKSRSHGHHKKKKPAKVKARLKHPRLSKLS
jgi:hypothetical protein